MLKPRKFDHLEAAPGRVRCVDCGYPITPKPGRVPVRCGDCTEYGPPRELPARRV